MTLFPIISLFFTPKSGAIARRVAMAAAFLLVMTVPTRGQTLTPEQIPNERPLHWRKYVNKDYGLSLWYPNGYKHSNFDGVCKDNEYRRYLLCLKRQDSPDSTILVSIIVAVPFFVGPNNGDVMPIRQIIGHHIFFCGVGGSMGTGFTDECIFDLRDKVLEFRFSPAETINSGTKRNRLGFEVLKTFRVL